MTVAMKQKFDETVVPALKEAHGYKNPMEVPRISKVVINMGVNAKVDRDGMKAVTDDLARITGQRPVVTKARKSVSNFALREGMVIGAKVTLRGAHMFEFLDRLINVALPRIRDFRGVSDKAFDGGGNYTLGLREQTIFPEINPDTVKRNQGMDITIVTTAKTDGEARDMLKQLGMPFTA